MKKFKIAEHPKCPKSIRKKLQAVAAEISECFKSCLESGQDVDKYNWHFAIRKVLRKWKLKRFKHTGCSGFAYKSKDESIVVKCPYVCDGEEGVPPCACPTEFVELPHSYGAIYIQPLIDVSLSVREATCDLLEACRFASELADCHPGNTGSFRGYAVVHDW
jgi:hypothetical protein